jgi:hypothetical protein
MVTNRKLEEPNPSWPTQELVENPNSMDAKRALRVLQERAGFFADRYLRQYNPKTERRNFDSQWFEREDIIQDLLCHYFFLIQKYPSLCWGDYRRLVTTASHTFLINLFMRVHSVQTLSLALSVEDETEDAETKALNYLNHRGSATRTIHFSESDLLVLFSTFRSMLRARIQENTATRPANRQGKFSSMAEELLFILDHPWDSEELWTQETCESCEREHYYPTDLFSRLLMVLGYDVREAKKVRRTLAGILRDSPFRSLAPDEVLYCYSCAVA